MKTKKTETVAAPAPAPAATSKLQMLMDLLSREGGADLSDMMTATGWQAHSVRGALAGSLKKKGLTIESVKVESRRVYRIVPGGAQ